MSLHLHRLFPYALLFYPEEETINSSETLVNFYPTTWHHILEDGNVIFMVSNMTTSNLAKDTIAVLE
jgi:hypothetical protein